MEPLDTIQAIQERHQQLWASQPLTRENLIRRLETRGVEIVGTDYVDADRIAAHMVATSLKIPRNIPPEAIALLIGREQWIPDIVHLLNGMRKSAGGRPRNDDDADRLLRLVEASNDCPAWKAIADDFEKETGREKSAEACRSAVRRRRARQDKNSI